MLNEGTKIDVTKTNVNSETAILVGRFIVSFLRDSCAKNLVEHTLCVCVRSFCKLHKRKAQSDTKSKAKNVNTAVSKKLWLSNK
jgi:hypothetical protein